MPGISDGTVLNPCQGALSPFWDSESITEVGAERKKGKDRWKM